VVVVDAAFQKYYEDTSKKEVMQDGVMATMQTSIKKSTEKLYKKLSKITIIASPTLGLD